MGDHSHALHFVDVLLDLWTQGDGAFPGGMYDGMSIRMERDCVLTGETTNPCKLIWELLNQVISGLSAQYWGELWPDSPTYARLSNLLYTAEP